MIDSSSVAIGTFEVFEFHRVEGSRWPGTIDRAVCRILENSESRANDAFEGLDYSTPVDCPSEVRGRSVSFDAMLRR